MRSIEPALSSPRLNYDGRVIPSKRERRLECECPDYASSSRAGPRIQPTSSAEEGRTDAASLEDPLRSRGSNRRNCTGELELDLGIDTREIIEAIPADGSDERNHGSGVARFVIPVNGISSSASTPREGTAEVALHPEDSRSKQCSSYSPRIPVQNPLFDETRKAVPFHSASNRAPSGRKYVPRASLLRHGLILNPFKLRVVRFEWIQPRREVSAERSAARDKRTSIFPRQTTPRGNNRASPSPLIYILPPRDVSAFSSSLRFAANNFSAGETS